MTYNDDNDITLLDVITSLIPAALLYPRLSRYISVTTTTLTLNMTIVGPVCRPVLSEYRWDKELIVCYNM